MLKTSPAVRENNINRRYGVSIRRIDEVKVYVTFPKTIFIKIQRA